MKAPVLGQLNTKRENVIDLRHRRLQICRVCDCRRELPMGVLQCKECGCIMTAKAAFPNQKCPLAKW